MRALTRIAVLVILGISCTCGQDENLLGLPEFDIFELEEDADFYKFQEKVAEPAESVPEELLRSLCEEYDLQLEDRRLDCLSIRIVPKTPQIEDHDIRKRQAEETPVEGSGEPEEIAPLNEEIQQEAESPPEEPAPEVPPPEEPAPEEPAPEVPVPEEPAPEEPAPEVPVPEEPVPEVPAPEEPVPEEPAPEEPVPEEPVPEEPVPEEPAPEVPVPEEPAPEEPAPEEPVPEEPAPEEPVPEEPAPEVPVPEEPAPQELAAEVPAPGVDAPDAPVPEEPSPDAPAPEEPPAEVAPPADPVPEVPTADEETETEQPVLYGSDKDDGGEQAPAPTNEETKAEEGNPEAPAPAPEETKAEGEVPAVVKKGRVLRPGDVQGAETNKEGGGTEEVHQHQSGNAVVEAPGGGTLEGSDAAISKMSAKENLKENASSDLPKSGESSETTQQGRKDSKILVILLVAVVAIGCAAFAYNFVKKRKQKKAEASRAENGNGALQKTEKDAEQGTELKPLMKNNEEKPVVEYQDEKDSARPVAAT